jgi:hypothetical protein
MCSSKAISSVAPNLSWQLHPYSSLAFGLRRDRPIPTDLQFQKLQRTQIVRFRSSECRQGLMRSTEFDWHDCVAPIPKDARAGFEQARGETFAYSIGLDEKSGRRRAVYSRWGSARTARRKRPEAIVSDISSTRSSKTAGVSGAGIQGKPGSGVRSIGRSLVSVLMRRVVAPGTRCWRGLGIGSISPITRQRLALARGRIAGENGTCAPFGSGPTSSPGSYH